MRLIIVTGKGGVGKTSVSAATARRCAEKGHRTLAMSTDAAHSLADSMGVPLGGDIVSVGPNLDALEIDIIHEMKTKWSEIQEYVAAFMMSQGMEGLSAEEMAILPGMELISALMYILDFHRRGTYDVVVMDTAPTAETLRLLSFPDISEWYAERLYALLKRVLTLARATVGRFMDMPLPSAKVLDSISEIKDKMIAVKEVLEDPEVTTVRLVVNPELMVVNETMRAYSYLCLYNKTVECLVVNRVIPDDASDGYFSEKLEEQGRYLEMIHQAFDPMKMLYARQLRTEMLGPEKLDALADMLYGESDPSDVYATESPMTFESDEREHRIVLKVPFADRSQVDLFKSGDDSIVLQVGSQKRTINLPLVLASSELAGAELRDQRLTIRFRRERRRLKARRAETPAPGMPPAPAGGSAT